MEKQTEKQFNALKSSKTDEGKQIESIFPQNHMNDLIRDSLKESLNYKIVLY